MAAFEIVWYHTGISGHEIAYSGLSSFLCISTFLECSRPVHRPLDVRPMMQRLLTPWIFWFAVFALFNLARHKPLFVADKSIVQALLVGTSWHLWYMPFMFMALLALRLFLRSPWRNVIPVLAAVLVTLILLLADLWRPWSLSIGPPYAQYAQALCPFLFGIVLARAVESLAYRTVAVFLILGMFALSLRPLPGVGLPYAIGCLSVWAAIALAEVRLPIASVISIASTLMLGVYLIHPLFLGVCRSILQLNGPMGVVVAFSLSVALIALIRRLGGRFARAVT